MVCQFQSIFKKDPRTTEQVEWTPVKFSHILLLREMASHSRTLSSDGLRDLSSQTIASYEHTYKQKQAHMSVSLGCSSQIIKHQQPHLYDHSKNVRVTVMSRDRIGLATGSRNSHSVPRYGNSKTCAFRLIRHLWVHLCGYDLFCMPTSQSVSIYLSRPPLGSGKHTAEGVSVTGREMGERRRFSATTALLGMQRFGSYIRIW